MGRRGAVWGGGAAPLETPGMGESGEGVTGDGLSIAGSLRDLDRGMPSNGVRGSLIPSGV